MSMTSRPLMPISATPASMPDTQPSLVGKRFSNLTLGWYFLKPPQRATASDLNALPDNGPGDAVCQGYKKYQPKVKFENRFPTSDGLVFFETFAEGVTQSIERRFQKI